MIECDLEIQKPDVNWMGNVTYEKHLLSDYNVFTQDVIIQSIKRSFNFSKTDVSNTRFFTGATDESRTITVPFFTYDKYIHNFQLVRDDLYGLFGDDIIYIRELRNGEYATGKQYQVYLSEIIEPKQSYKFSEGALVFETAESPYARSILSTAELEEKGILAEGDWSYGMGLKLVNDDVPKYSFKMVPNKKCHVLNAGNINVDPYEQKLRIEITEIVFKNNGDKGQLNIYNDTNNSHLVFWLDKKVEKIVIDDTMIYFDGFNAKIGDTGFLELKKGVNELMLSDYEIESLKISLDFYFEYR